MPTIALHEPRPATCDTFKGVVSRLLRYIQLNRSMFRVPEKFLVRKGIKYLKTWGRLVKHTQFGPTAGDVRFSPRSPPLLTRVVESSGGRSIMVLAAKALLTGALLCGYYKGAEIAVAEDAALAANYVTLPPPTPSVPPAGGPDVSERSNGVQTEAFALPDRYGTIGEHSIAHLVVSVMQGFSHLGATGIALFVANTGGLGAAGATVLVILANGLVHTSYIKGWRDRSMAPIDEMLARGGFPASVRAPASVITPVIYIDGDPPEAEILRIAREKFARYKRFRSVPRPNPAGLGWTWVPCDLDVSAHIHMHRVRDETDLKARVQDIALSPLRRPDLPQWEIHIIKNEGTGRSAICPRLSHCIGDGISLSEVFTDMVTRADGGPPQKRSPFRRRETSFVPSLARAASLVRAAGEAAALPFATRDMPTPFRPDGPLVCSGRQRIVDFPEVPLDVVKSIKNAAGATVNDVVMAAFAGAARRYMSATGHEVPGDGQMRALIPVAFPRRRLEGDAKAENGLCNNWSFASLPLPVHSGSRAGRLRAMQASTTHAKTTPTVFIQSALQNALFSLVPASLVRSATRDVMGGHSVCFSNVPGPQEPLRVGDADIVGVQVVFPNVLPQVCVLSYNGTVYGNIVVDEEMFQTPELLALYYGEEIERLASEYGV